jgi:Cu/Ag efflux protein CusF
MKQLFAAMVATSLAAGGTASTQAADTMGPGMAGHASVGEGMMAPGVMGGMDQSTLPNPGPAAAPLTEGTIKSVDRTGGTLTLAHGPLPNGMPAMTMPYRVQDPAWLAKLKSGQTVRFAVEESNGAWTIVRLEAVTR